MKKIEMKFIIVYLFIIFKIIKNIDLLFNRMENY